MVGTAAAVVRGVGKGGKCVSGAPIAFDARAKSLYESSGARNKARRELGKHVLGRALAALGDCHCFPLLCNALSGGDLLLLLET